MLANEMHGKVTNIIPTKAYLNLGKHYHFLGNDAKLLINFEKSSHKARFFLCTLFGSFGIKV